MLGDDLPQNLKIDSCQGIILFTSLGIFDLLTTLIEQKSPVQIDIHPASMDGSSVKTLGKNLLPERTVVSEQITNGAASRREREESGGDQLSAFCIACEVGSND